MKVYCLNENCPNHIKGYAICTALDDITKCPERQKEDKPDEADGEGDSNL
jgi:hypothetical protein